MSGFGQWSEVLRIAPRERDSSPGGSYGHPPARREAEERLFYPALLHLGEGVGGDETPEAETKDAIHDHNEIRDAVAAVAERAVGSDDWYEAIAAANKANGDHMAEEEREGLTDFRRHASLQARHDLGVAFAAFEAAHVSGIEPKDKDPQEYIDKRTRGGD